MILQDAVPGSPRPAERFAATCGDWRAVIPKVVDQFLACGLLEHGFARIRCDACTHEYLLAFSCKCRYFCPSCHAKRLARWSLWLDETLLAPVPHRQVVLTLPKRLRAYCVYRRARLGDLARVAARTVTAAVRATTGEADLKVGIVACLQTHGSLANWHPHLHLVATDGGFRPDGTFVRWPGWPSHDTVQLTEAFRRAVLRLFVRRGLFDEAQAQGMLQWPHSGCHVHAGVGVPEDDRAFAPSTMSLSVLERTREIGVMRAIGARHRAILTIVQVEGLVIAIASWALAIPLSIPMSVILGNAFGRIMIPVKVLTLFPEPMAILIWLGVVVAVSLLACAWPGYRATRITTAAALAYE